MKLRSLTVGLLCAMAVAACGGSSTGSTTKAAVTPPPDSDLLTAGTLTIGSDVSYPPQEFFDPPGSKTPVGFDIDMGKALADKMGLKFATQNQGFTAIIDGLTSKKYDLIISAMTINDERKQKVDFVPYFVAGESFVVAKGGSKHPTKLEDLCGLNVAVEKSTAEETEVDGLNKTGAACAKNKVRKQAFDVDTEALVQLAKGAVDVHFTDSPVAGYEIKKNTNIEVSGAVIEVAPEGVAVRKGDDAMLTAVKAAFDAMKADGTYDNLLKKWGVADGDVRKSTT